MIQFGGLELYLGELSPQKPPRGDGTVWSYSKGKVFRERTSALHRQKPEKV